MALVGKLAIMPRMVVATNLQNHQCCRNMWNKTRLLSSAVTAVPTLREQGLLPPEVRNRRNENTCFSNYTHGLFSVPARGYAKGKDKGGKAKKKAAGKGAKNKPKVELTEEELTSVIDFDHFKADMELTITHLKEDYQVNLSLRTNLGTFDSLVIETEDGNFPLIKIGRVVMKNPTLAVINMTANPRYTNAVTKAIENSGMNLNPQQDGTSVFVPIPKVTREHRENLAKNAKMLCDKSKDKLKVIQNNYIRAIKKEQALHSKDLIHNLQETVHSLALDYMEQADSLMQHKKDELLS